VFDEFVGVVVPDWSGAVCWTVGVLPDGGDEGTAAVDCGVTLVSDGVKSTLSPVSSLITSSAIFSTELSGPRYFTDTIPMIATNAIRNIKII
jgi:hypothetical protein